MKKKLGPQFLEPIKITKTEATTNHLLLEMMSKLVKEQRESNRLLRKMAGEQSQAPIEETPSIIGSGRIEKALIKRKAESLQKKETPHRVKSLADSVNPSSESLPKLDDLEKDSIADATQLYHNQMIAKMNQLTKSVKRIEQSFEKKVKIELEQKKRPSTEIQGGGISRQVEKGQREQVQGEGKDFPAKRLDLSRFLRGEKEDKKDQSIDLPRNMNQADFFSKMLSMGGLKQEEFRNQKEADQKKNYSMLSEILPYSDRREIKIKFPIEEMVSHYKGKEEEMDLVKVSEEWLGLVYRATASICWNMLSNGLLTFDETKILFTENIIFNFIEFMRSIRSLGYERERTKLVNSINSTSVSILDFLCSQYPQTKVEDPNIALRSQIPFIDNKGRAKFDLVSQVCRDEVVAFRKKQSGDYTSEIMRTINYMIDKTNLQFSNFHKVMSGLFGEIFLLIEKRGLEDRGKETNEDQLYFEKVKSYTKYLIGRKVNKNTPLYSEPEIQNGVFFVKSPSVLRIITKWVEELSELITKPSEIKNQKIEFKNHRGLPVHLYAQLKNALSKKIKEDKEKFEKKVEAIKKECYNMEVLLTLERFTADPNQIHLSEEQISVGKYCTYLKSAISSYICSELNEVIDFLLSVPLEVDESKIGEDSAFHESARQSLDEVNLIHCKIFDLLRCKCISKESEIVYLLKKLKDKNDDPDDPFTIVRIKDRLSMGTRDILINAILTPGGLVCEIQLAVVSNIDKKQELLDQYNHFLYELKRAKLGSITENASIWSALEQRATFFSHAGAKSNAFPIQRDSHPCFSDFRKSENRSVSRFVRPLICASCHIFFEIPRTCLSNVICDNCQNTYCGECHFSYLNAEDRKAFVFQKKLFKSLLPFLTEYRDYDQPLPLFGFLIRKFYLKKELFYFRVIKNKRESAESSSNQVSLELVISVVEKGAKVNKILNKSEILGREVDGQIFLQKGSKKQFSNYLIYGIRVEGRLEKVTLPFKELIQNFTKMQAKFIDVMKQPAYMQNLKVIKKTKLIKREINSFEGILSNDTKITYLKINRKVFVVQVDVEEQQLQAQLIKVINLQRLQTYALEKVDSVSMEYRGVTDEMDLLKSKLPIHLLEDFSKRLVKLFLNFGQVKDIKFVQNFPHIRVLFITDNQISSLEGVQNLKHLVCINFDKNHVRSLEPLTNARELTKISGAENQVESLKGLQHLTKIKKINLYCNNIKKVEYLQKLTSIKGFLMGRNNLETTEGILHCSEMLDLSLGQTKIADIVPLKVFTKIKRLALNGLGLKQIGKVFRSFDDLNKLNLSNNQIQKIENLDEMVHLNELNLRHNKITQIEGLDNAVKLKVLKISHNRITDIVGIQSLEQLTVLKIVCNPLQKCSDLFKMNRKQLKVIFKEEGDKGCPEESRPKDEFQKQYQRLLQTKSSSSGSNSGSADNDDDEDEDD